LARRQKGAISIAFKSYPFFSPAKCSGGGHEVVVAAVHKLLVEGFLVE
jgi:hypothetical protein